MDNAAFYLNGIDGCTGESLTLSLSALYEMARTTPVDPAHARELQAQRDRDRSFPLGWKYGVDPQKLSSAGWGVIFADVDAAEIPRIKAALRPLLDLRHEQAGDRYREFDGQLQFAQHGDCYRQGDSKQNFLARHGKGSGVADPDKVPYYLLIVASPGVIPFDFQYQLDVQYAVGRLFFSPLVCADWLDCYARYAEAVVESERQHAAVTRRITLFGPEHADDLSTKLSCTRLVEPLAARLQQPNWCVETVTGAAATKASLAPLLGGATTPDLLFTAGHGMVFPREDSRQIPHQGALLCADWPGPRIWKAQGQRAIPPSYYFAADDLPVTANTGGLISFHFACFGAGTPQLTEYPHLTPYQPDKIAAQSFVAALPQRLLGNPGGSALAVIGHVDRAWAWSFVGTDATHTEQLESFESVFRAIMDGQPVGLAMEPFGSRYAELSCELSEDNKKIDLGLVPDYAALSVKWTESSDARSYIILGDPAVHLPSPTDAERGAP